MSKKQTKWLNSNRPNKPSGRRSVVVSDKLASFIEANLDLFEDVANSEVDGTMLVHRSHLTGELEETTAWCEGFNPSVNLLHSASFFSREFAASGVPEYSNPLLDTTFLSLLESLVTHSVELHQRLFHEERDGALNSLLVSDFFDQRVLETLVHATHIGVLVEALSTYILSGDEELMESYRGVFEQLASLLRDVDDDGSRHVEFGEDNEVPLAVLRRNFQGYREAFLARHPGLSDEELVEAFHAEREARILERVKAINAEFDSLEDDHE